MYFEVPVKTYAATHGDVTEQAATHWHANTAGMTVLDAWKVKTRADGSVTELN